jgi:hypothetical protein
MKQYFVQFLFVLTIFIVAEFVILDKGSIYHEQLPSIAETGWVYENDPTTVLQPSFFKEFPVCTDAAPALKSFEKKDQFLHFHPFHYQEPIQVTNGYRLVFLISQKSNIPHLNQDDEDPAFIVG